IYFKNKQRVLPNSSKNLLIYNGNTCKAYQEIIRLYNLQGNLIFNHIKRSILNHINDPFQPDGLNIYTSSNYGAPSKPSAKPRKRNPLQMQLSDISSNIPSNLPLNSSPLPFSTQKRQTKRIRQNLRKNNNFHNKENIQIPTNNTQFILPSLKKPKLTEYIEYNFDEVDELEPLEDELNIDQMKETCPFCDEILPDPMSDRMKLALDRINNKQGKISASDWMDFCFIHFAELSIIPSGIANKYPFIINFDELPCRINRFKDDLTEIINGNTHSYYLSFTKQVYQEVGHKKAAAPMMLMNRFQSLRPEYYGTKDALLIANTLIDFFITTKILTPVNSYPLQTANYIQEVLVPETVMRLIFEDIGGNSSLETAQNIMIASSDFGDYVHSCDNE
ncbi:hypothetical protein RhiirA4_506071, partial [Rhizophagus irregularis]